MPLVSETTVRESFGTISRCRQEQPVQGVGGQGGFHGVTWLSSMLAKCEYFD